MRIKSLAQGENILMLGIEPSTFVSKIDILTTTPMVHLIRPHLEYANVIGYPKYKYQSISVKRVQRIASKFLMETRHMTYTQWLEYLDLPSLWYGGLRGDMIQVFKIINGIDDINCEKFFEFTDYDGTRNIYKKLYIQYARTQSKKCTFSRRSAPV